MKADHRPFDEKFMAFYLAVCRFLRTFARLNKPAVTLTSRNMKLTAKSILRVASRLRSSLVARLTLLVVAFVALLFIVAVSAFFLQSRQAVKEEAIDLAMQNLDKTVQTIDNILMRAEITSDNMLWLVEHHLDSPDLMFEYSRQTLQNNPELYGCSIAFEPYFFKGRGRYFSAYSHRGDSITTEQEGSDLYQYFTLDWYRTPVLQDKPCWVEPFYENVQSGIMVNDAITSYCRPIRDASGRTVGVLSVDVAIDDLSASVVAAKPYPHSYNAVCSQMGAYIVHPDTTKLFHANIKSLALQEQDPEVTAIVNNMLDGKSGYSHCTLKGESAYVFYQPFKKAGWSVAIVCTETDIFSNYSRLQTYTMLIAVAGLLLLLLVCWMFINRQFRPLSMLARSAVSVAAGDFSQHIPHTTAHNEVGLLQNSFARMQHSLATHVEKARELADSLSLRNKELATIYERSKEVERVKTAFLNNTTDQLVEPVGVITGITAHIRAHYPQMSDEEMNALVERMQTNADTVAELLNRMIDVALKESTATLQNQTIDNT